MNEELTGVWPVSKYLANYPADKNKIISTREETWCE